MNKYLMLTAAALLGSATTALPEDQSRTHSIHLLSENGGSYCDGLKWQKFNFPADLQYGTHLNVNCTGSTSKIAGGVNKEGWGFSDNYSNFSSESLFWDISKPFKDGSAWSLWVCLNGSTSCVEANTGTYKVGFPANGGSRVSTMAKVAKIIAERKAARAPTAP
jgi:hypothetical protein